MKESEQTSRANPYKPALLVLKHEARPLSGAAHWGRSISMITLTHTDVLNSFKTTYSIDKDEAGDYLVSRKTQYSEEQQTVRERRAGALEQLLRQLPGPDGANDIEGLLYDGDLLTITRDGYSKTTIALSTSLRQDSLLWWNKIKELLKQ